MSTLSAHHQNPSPIDPTSPAIVTFESCLAEAQALVRQRQHQSPHSNIKRVFIALAKGDTDVGLLAYYLWRRRLQS